MASAPVITASIVASGMAPTINANPDAKARGSIIMIMIISRAIAKARPIFCVD